MVGSVTAMQVGKGASAKEFPTMKQLARGVQVLMGIAET